MNFTTWRNAGSPFQLARPVQDLAATLRRYGYTVGTIGNKSHLTARIPEDHVPYSATGWPKPNPYPWVHAGDIMSPPAGKGLPSLAQLGAQIVADRQAGLDEIKWLKYINWTNAAGHCLHETWMPNHAVRDSNDVGHIHLSARTDFTRVPSTYDPVARIRGHKPESAPAKRPTPKFTRIIRLTQPPMRGSDVEAWQHQMKALRYAITSDGVFGPKSESVLLKFQRDHKLAVDGVLGPVSWRAAWA